MMYEYRYDSVSVVTVVFTTREQINKKVAVHRNTATL